SKYKDNAWFVGVTPRRNPEIVVALLFEGGEHGQFAARIAAQVVKAFVEKKRRVETKMASTTAQQDPLYASDRTTAPARNGSVEVGAVWSAPDEHEEGK